ncbi:type II toxin-antitoxin system CcdA family antitoxin [Nocardioides baculatus]|uniref:Type II toxin-antitoxin system CcdA family antitoxin n=1 Tax=Nocardioides baculatus TaxID=2801337 RepID=A0ABS1LF38_9ACTN|nr:type II toxin-antitoxin system CcdA family antitoxin [Nocardioides baculatus]MBL0749271.1 type II toxin-antitoxin system CcdA family antitoxin [Nocardioides baculatus]
MARLNVYVPDDLAARAREAGLNVSSLTQQALAGALASTQTDAWLSSLPRPGASSLAAEVVLDALDAARDELGARG